MLHKGQYVTVYEDPIKQSVKVGNAKIEEVVREFAQNVWLCRVNFVGDDPSLIVDCLVPACSCSASNYDPACLIHRTRFVS